MPPQQLVLAGKRMEDHAAVSDHRGVLLGLAIVSGEVSDDLERGGDRASCDQPTNTVGHGSYPAQDLRQLVIDSSAPQVRIGRMGGIGHDVAWRRRGLRRLVVELADLFS